jgi:hypothetical protein
MFLEAPSSATSVLTFKNDHGVHIFMSDATSLSFSAKLGELTTQLRTLEQSLKDNTSVSAPALAEFRQALDNVRLTAWTVSELQNARQIKRDARAVTSFLTAERLRRFRQMVKDLRADLDHDGPNWPSQSIDDLQDSITNLREGLGLLAYSRKGTPNDQK